MKVMVSPIRWEGAGLVVVGDHSDQRAADLRGVLLQDEGALHRAVRLAGAEAVGAGADADLDPATVAQTDRRRPT